MSTLKIPSLFKNRRFWGWLVVGGFWSLIAAGLLWYAPRMYPVPVKSPDVLWKYGFMNNRKSDPNSYRPPGTIYGPWHGWYVCEISHMHGSHLFCVPEEEIEADFLNVVGELVKDSKAYSSPWLPVGLEKWQQRRNDERTAKNLVADLRKERLNYYSGKLTNFPRNDPDLYAFVRSNEENAHDRFRRCWWYWSTIAFEALFLGGLTWLVFGLIIHGGWIRCAVCLALVPVLFMLPVYLGYATYSFTSAGPTGGVLYPHLLMYVRGGSCNDFDKVILDHLPPILEPLSSPIGSPLVLSGRGLPGPTSMLKMGLGLALIPPLIRFGPTVWRKLNRLLNPPKKKRKQEIANPT